MPAAIARSFRVIPNCWRTFARGLTSGLSCLTCPVTSETRLLRKSKAPLPLGNGAAGGLDKISRCAIGSPVVRDLSKPELLLDLRAVLPAARFFFSRLLSFSVFSSVLSARYHILPDLSSGFSWQFFFSHAFAMRGRDRRCYSIPGTGHLVGG